MESRKLCLGCMRPKGDEEVCGNCGWWEGTPSESSHYLPSGTLVKDRYLLGRILGQGGFGITYLGWDEVLNTRVAVKEFMPPGIAVRTPGQVTVTALKSGEMETLFTYGIERFLDEARTLARFEDYPGVVSVKDVFRANGTAYMVMQYLEGMTLNEYRLQKGGIIPYPAAAEIMMPVLDTLREVHREGILHRDISPDNIFITRSGTVKLLDFGAARFAMGEKSVNYSVILKAGYAPEEQYRSRGRQGEYTDVYSVAATLYQLITGQLPLEALDRLSEDTLLSPSQMGVKIPVVAEAALMKALSVKAEMRYQSIAEFQEDLLSAEGQGDRTAVIEQLLPGVSSEETVPVGVRGADVDETGSYGMLDDSVEGEPPVEFDSTPASLPVKTTWAGLSRQTKNGLLAAVVGVVLLTTGVWYAMSHKKIGVPEPAVTVASGNTVVNQSAVVQVPVDLSVKAETAGENKNDDVIGQELPKNEVIPKEGPQEKIDIPRKQSIDTLPASEPSSSEGGVKGDVSYGKFTFSDGSVYEGEFKDQKCNGQGVLTFPDGTKYTGEFRDGRMNGQGTYIMKDGLKYVGNIKNNLFDGQGTLTSPDGNKYEGDWKDNKMHGWGKWTYPDGTKYIGGFSYGKKSGYGNRTYSDGSGYDGEWKNDLPNGWGTMTFPDGAVYSGVFKDGLPVKS